ncbi:unnamed protein product [Hydatigera taeniaeformis]|uniref:Uncharacterized protein n=1 Tax=Hydatigena taeniaeformis TaxID=6205 RepID=A0A0R3X199_HYDTA|nr:unnamed protein product [Hydatigera taeniaeformis]
MFPSESSPPRASTSRADTPSEDLNPTLKDTAIFTTELTVLATLFLHDKYPNARAVLPVCLRFDVCERINGDFTIQNCRFNLLYYILYLIESLRFDTKRLTTQLIITRIVVLEDVCSTDPTDSYFAPQNDFYTNPGTSTPLGSGITDNVVLQLAPFPALSLELLHSRDFFSCTGPLLIVVQGCNESTLGVWEPTHLMKEGNEPFSRNLKTGSQIEFVKLAHSRGYQVAFLNLNCLAAETSIPDRYSERVQACHLNCDVFPSHGASQSDAGPSDRFSALFYLQQSPALICDVQRFFFPPLPETQQSVVSLGERMACGWEALMARCRSSNIVVWVHRRAEESFFYPLCPTPQTRTRQPWLLRPTLGNSEDGDGSTQEPISMPHSLGSQPSSSGTSSLHCTDTHRRKLIATWADRAKSYWLSLQSRVKAVVFVDPCQMFTSFPQSGVGWGLLDPNATAATLSLQQQDIDRLREWFAQARLPNCV